MEIWITKIGGKTEDNLKIKVKIIGTGKVKKQSIQPGEALEKVKTITLELSWLY